MERLNFDILTFTDSLFCPKNVLFVFFIKFMEFLIHKMAHIRVKIYRKLLVLYCQNP